MRRRIGRDLFSLGFVQMAGFVLPLFSLPYLTRVLGVTAFGEYSIILAIISILSVISDYGYVTNGTRLVSINSDNINKISAIVGIASSIRFMLAMSSFVLFSLVARFFIDISVLTYLLIFLSLVANSIILPWLFQGLGKLYSFSLFNLAVRLLAFLLLFYAVRSSKDINTAIVIYMIPQIAALFYFFFFLKNNKIIWRPNIDCGSLIKEFKDGLHFFLPNLYSIFFTNIGIIALGVFQSSGAVGIYSVNDKIIKACVSLSGIVNQAFYPVVAAKMHESSHEGTNFIKKIATIFLPIFLLLCIVLSLAGDKIIKIAFGAQYDSSPSIMSYYPMYILLANINSFIGIMYLTTSGREKLYSNSFMYGTLIAVTLYFILPHFISYHAPAVGIIIGELFIFLYIVFKIRRRRV